VGINFENVRKEKGIDARVYASFKGTKKVNDGRYGLSPENARGTSSIWSLGGTEVTKVALEGLGLLPSVEVLLHPTSAILTCSSQVFCVSGAVRWSMTLYAIKIVPEHEESRSGHFW